MTSTNSSSNFMKRMKYNVRRNCAAVVVFQIISLLMVIVCLANVTAYDSDISGSVTEIFGVDFIRLFSIVSVAQIFILTAALFRMLFSKRASDLLFSVPVKRSTWYHTAFILGFIVIVLSYVVAAVISVCYFKFYVLNKFPNLSFEMIPFIKLFILSFLAVVVFYVVFMMCASVSGRMWQYVFLSFISTVVFCIGVCGFISYVNTIYGVWISLGNSFFVSPVGIILNDIQPNVIPRLYIAAAVQFAVAYAAGCFAFKKRKAEVAENSLSGKILPFALTVICFLSEIFLCLAITELSAKAKLIAGIVAALITAVILSAIFFRKVFSKKIGISLAAAVALSAVVVLSVQFVPEKTFVNCVPESSDVESVKVYSYGELGTPSIIDFLYGINYLSLYDVDDDTQPDIYEFKTDAGKEKAKAFHTKCLAEETRRSADMPSYRIQDNCTWKLEYTLKNGKKVVRTYTVSAALIYKEFADLLQTDEGIGQIYRFSIDPKDVICADLDFERMVMVRYQGKSISSNPILLDSEHIDSIFKCIKKDMQNAVPLNFAMYYGNFYIPGNYTMNVDDNFNIDFYMYSDKITEAEKAKLQGMTAQEMLDYNTHYVNETNWDHPLLETYSYPIFYDDKNTVSYLEEIGFTFHE